MTTPETVGHRRASVPVYRRITASLAVLAARLLATQPPHRIRTVLRWVQRRARPATYEQAKAARDDVVAVSMICGAREGCVLRSLATVLLCRLYHGTTPTWCVGCRRVPPFGAHAWVQADDIAVDEAYPPAISARCSRCHDADGAHRAGGESHAVPSAAQ